VFYLSLLFLAAGYTQGRYRLKNNMKLNFKILGLFLFIQLNLCAQDSTTSKSYFLNAHIGADLAKGFRFGLLVYLNENISVEAGYGVDVINFLVASDPNKRYSIGINWHKGIESNLMAGISFSHSVFPSPYITKQNFISANVGSFISSTSGIKFFYKGGILFGFKNNNSGNHTLIFPNIDIGISYNIF
jgi:hypothetical protein